jgi:hypothetical protein
MHLSAAVSLGITCGWLSVQVLRARRGAVGYAGGGVAFAAMGLEIGLFFGWRGSLAFAIAALSGMLAHRLWRLELRQRRRSANP